LRAIAGSAFQRRAADGFVADQNPALGEQILDIAEAHGEAKGGPDSVLDDVHREAVALETETIHELRSL